MSNETGIPDAEQDDVVWARERLITVLAGPGSGKTQTLARRAGRLLSESGETAALLLTFTNKAGAELKARSLRTINVPAQRILACNYHSFGHLLLRSHGHLMGIDPDFEIADEDDAREIGQRSVPTAPVEYLLREWSRARLRLLEPDRVTQMFGVAYEKGKRAEGVVDFDDLIVYTARLLRDFPAVAKAYGDAYAHVLVDEFQDTNPAQFAIILSLLPHVRTLSVFADDDQAIFAFQHAEPAQMRNLVRVHGARELSLTTNYRCRARIVAVANALLSVDDSASGRTMKAYREGGQVAAAGYENERDEAAAVVGGVESLIAAGHAPRSIAILARNGYRLDATVAALRNRALPLSDWRGFAYGRAERKALATCLAVVRGRLSRGQVGRLCALVGAPVCADREVQGVFRALEGHQLAAGLAEVRRLAYRGAPVAEIVAVAARAVAVSRPELANGVFELATGVHAYQSIDPSFTLEHVLAEIAIGSGTRPPVPEGGVRVATIHRAKGLEWPTVFLIGLEERQLPDWRSATSEDVSEERRLCFVGVCRAADRLSLTYAAQYAGWGQVPSRFVQEMGLVTNLPG